MSSRDFSLMVKYETFNLCYVGSNPTGLNLFRGYCLFLNKSVKGIYLIKSKFNVNM